MGRELELDEQPLEQVIYMSSPVVEGLAVICAMTTGKQNYFTIELPYFQQLFPDHLVIKQLQQFQNDSVYDLFNLLIPIPYLDSVEQFTEKLQHMKLDYFLYYFWGEEVAFDIVQRLLQDPTTIFSMEDNYYWQTEAERQLYAEWLSQLATFKEEFTQLLLNIAQTSIFETMLTNKGPLMQESIESLQQLSLEPLALAQYVMGKTFRRVSLYKLYYFIPSYSLSPTRMRIFNETVCFVLYGCANPLSDEREKSEQLSQQLKAIADPNRLLMLRMLTTKKEYGAKLAEYLGITTATVSHHLEILKKAGLVTEEKIGTSKYFSVDRSEITKMLASLQRFTKA
ncbi:ArsR/SmtB family transcription factor [Bacillus ndiopicus]|uniref:ArsR/SmtB family transcription factor n=1 Tax=Bacillus ndiopicus TaxID=1347368 RepID=UPI0006944F17|nr:metalloregulator ArsR/SmtB family transcription factor [Bacillus ndiopicus]